MKIKTNSFSAILIKYGYKGEMPNTLCSYFWKALFVILFLPINFPILLINKFSFAYNNDKLNHFISLIFMIIGVSVYFTSIPSNQDGKIIETSLMYLFAHNHFSLTIFLSTLGAYIFITILLLIVFGVLFLVEHIKDKFETISFKRRQYNNLPTPDKKLNIVLEFFKSIKQKMCPIIEYIDEE